MTFGLSDKNIKVHLDELAARDVDIARAIKEVGYPSQRRGTCGFESFLRVISGQQLSVKAAATIHGRVEKLMAGDVCPENFMALSDEALRGAGMSRQKITYGRSLCEHVITGTLPVDDLGEMSDEDALAAITSVKGLGRWSAEMYLMFSLGRTDIWPVDDIAVRSGAGWIKGISERQTPKVVEAWGEDWRPFRSSVALLSWKYYSEAPL